jgi:hypothetical protein
MITETLGLGAVVGEGLDSSQAQFLLRYSCVTISQDQIGVKFTQQYDLHHGYWHQSPSLFVVLILPHRLAHVALDLQYMSAYSFLSIGCTGFV